MIFSVSVERGNGIARLRLSGEMDIAATRPFRDEVLVLEREGAHLLVELDGLTFIDSSGLHELVGLHDRGLKSGRAVEFIGPSDRMTKLFELTRIGYMITREHDSRLLASFNQNDG
jgi:anti-anti-sigma factor